MVRVKGIATAIARKRKLLVIIVGLVIIILGSLFAFKKFTAPKYDKTLPAYSKLQADKKAKKPTSKAALADYHGTIATDYTELGDDGRALSELKKAQVAFDASKSKDAFSYNVPIALQYQKDGDKKHAEEYYQREIDRLRALNSKGDYTASIAYYTDQIGKLQ